MIASSVHCYCCYRHCSAVTAAAVAIVAVAAVAAVVFDDAIAAAAVAVRTNVSGCHLFSYGGRGRNRRAGGMSPFFVYYEGRIS